MTARYLILAAGTLAACTSAQDLCFEKATHDYRVAKELIAQAEARADRGFEVNSETVNFVDVSECGPTLEDRAICTTQAQAKLPRYTTVDAQAEKDRAAELSAKLPALRAQAERDYRACVLSAPGA